MATACCQYVEVFRRGVGMATLILARAWLFLRRSLTTQAAVLQAAPASKAMNTLSSRGLTLLLALGTPASLLAAESTPASWHAQTLGQALGYMLLFAAVGIAAAVIGFKVFDKCTPGDLAKEILENKNVAAAIVAGSVILGVSLIIAAAMLG